MGLFDEIKSSMNKNSINKDMIEPYKPNIVYLEIGVTRFKCPTCRIITTLSERVESFECCGITYKAAPNL